MTEDEIQRLISYLPPVVVSYMKNKAAEEADARMLSFRDIDPSSQCKKCSGFGVRMYGSNSTWRGGYGGRVCTMDVCDFCWGSGNASKPWPSHSLLQTLKHNT